MTTVMKEKLKALHLRYLRLAAEAKSYGYMSKSRQLLRMAQKCAKRLKVLEEKDD